MFLLPAYYVQLPDIYPSKITLKKKLVINVTFYDNSLQREPDRIIIHIL